MKLEPANFLWNEQEEHEVYWHLGYDASQCYATLTSTGRRLSYSLFPNDKLILKRILSGRIPEISCGIALRARSTNRFLIADYTVPIEKRCLTMYAGSICGSFLDLIQHAEKDNRNATFPKGWRRSSTEDDLSCALREFEEETGISMSVNTITLWQPCTNDDDDCSNQCSSAEVDTNRFQILTSSSIPSPSSSSSSQSMPAIVNVQMCGSTIVTHASVSCQLYQTRLFIFECDHQFTIPPPPHHTTAAPKRNYSSQPQQEEEQQQQHPKTIVSELSNIRWADLEECQATFRIPAHIEQVMDYLQQASPSSSPLLLNQRGV